MVDDLDLVGFYLGVDVGHDGVQTVLHIVALNDHGEGIDARRNMLDAHAVAFEDRERAAHDAHLV